VFRSQLIDRFGQLPSVSEQLLTLVRIRLKAQGLGIERIVFKNKQLFLYFVTDQESAFYQSPVFTRIIGWIHGNPRRVQLKETKGKLCMVSKYATTIQDIYDMLEAMEGE
jgi:transcription-repair coupling factor (superfamily II helicase)